MRCKEERRCWGSQEKEVVGHYKRGYCAKVRRRRGKKKKRKVIIKRIVWGESRSGARRYTNGKGVVPKGRSSFNQGPRMVKAVARP